MNKKILLVIAIGVLIVFGFLVYFLLSKRQKPQVPPTIPSRKKEVEVKKVLDKKVFFPVLSGDESSILFFNAEKVTFYKLDLGLKKIEPIAQRLETPERVIWSKDRTKSLLKVIYNKEVFEKYDSLFKSPGTPDMSETTWLYDFKTKKLTQLNRNIKNVIWLKDGTKILYHFYDLENKINTISLAKPDGSSWEKIKDVDYNEGLGLGFISSEEIYYYPVLTEIGGSNLYKLNLKSKQTTQIIKDKTASGASVSPDGSKIAYQIYHEKKENYTLGIIKPDGTEKKDLGLEARIGKIVFSKDGKILIAALREQDKTTDTFYKIDIETSQKEEIKYQSQAPIDAQNLILAKDSKTLYFTSDDYLYKLEI